MSFDCRRGGTGAGGAARWLAVLGAATLRSGALADRPTARLPVLRVCADPNNLPFSDRREEGFENRVAEILARELGARLEYTWWAQRRGPLRHTLDTGACNVVLGVPAGSDAVLPTRPWYRSSYYGVPRPT
jgi:mxaJ protein